MNLTYGLVDEYDEIRAKIDDVFMEPAESGDFADFLSKEAVKLLEIRKVKRFERRVHHLKKCTKVK